MKNRNKRDITLRVLLFCFFILFLLEKSSAQEFIIGVEDIDYYPLYEFKSNRDTYSKELLNKFAASKGYKFIYLPIPIKRFEKWFFDEKIDLKYPDNPYWYTDSALPKNTTFSQSTIKLVAGTTVLKTSLNKNKSSFKTLGTLLGFYPATWIKQIRDGQVKLYEDISTKILIKKLLAKHIDGVDLEPSVIQYYLKMLGENTEVAVINKRYEYEVYNVSLSTIKHPKVIIEFNDFLKNNQQLIEEMKQKYHIFDYKPYLK